ALKAIIQLGEKRVQRLLDAETLPDSTAGALEEIQAVLERAQRYTDLEVKLTDNLGDMSQMQRSKLQIHPLASDLVAIVWDVVEGQRLSWPTRIFTLEVPTKSVPVLADRDRIMQVVTNYLTNAVKFSPEDQPIKVQVRREARVARVLVRDYGVGLPAAE